MSLPPELEDSTAAIADLTNLLNGADWDAGIKALGDQIVDLSQDRAQELLFVAIIACWGLQKKLVRAVMAP